MTNVWSKQAKRNYFHYRLLDKRLAYIHSVFKLTFTCLLVFLKMSWNLQEKLPSLLCKIPVLVLFIWNIFVLTLVISLTLNIWLSQNVCFLSGLTCLLMSLSPFYLFILEVICEPDAVWQVLFCDCKQTAFCILFDFLFWPNVSDY